MKQLDPKSIWIFLIPNIMSSVFFVFVAIPIAILMFAAEGGNTEVYSFNSLLLTLLGAFVVAIVLCFIWAKLVYRFYRYELTDDGFRKEQGVISKKYVIIPYSRIQNIDIYRGVIDRLLGLSRLYIQTAGLSGGYGPHGMTGGSEGSLPGLSKEVAKQLREELIQRIKQSSKDQGL